MNDTSYLPTSRTRPLRRAERTSYDRALIHSILDEALIGTLATIIDGEPFAQPMIHARDGEAIILHGSHANRMLNVLRTGAPACLSVSLIDGIILGRSVPDHSFQYRSVSVHGICVEVLDPDEKRQRMKRVFDHIVAKRWEELPPVEDAYLSSVRVLLLPLADSVARVNADEPKIMPDAAAHTWTGVLPFALTAGPLRPVPELQQLPLATALLRYDRKDFVRPRQ
jgi:hypothetical protein